MTIATAPVVTAPRTVRSLSVIAVFWAALVMLQFGTLPALLDPDMFHEMSLAREILATGHVPLQDSFAYTPTITPVIHHEWGMGMLLYFVATRGGMAGIYLLLMVLAAGIAGVCIKVARTRGATWPAIIICMPLAGPLGIVAYGAVRAQFFTSLFMAVLLLMLESDRRGKRWWIPAWFVLYVAWVNIHGGFLVGLGVLGLHWAEMAIRTRRWQFHLLLVLLVTTALSGVSPYGYAHFASVVAGSMMPRPLIEEWGPIWTEPIRASAFAFSILPLAYCLGKIGWRRARGLLLVVVCAVLCILHRRHSGLYAVAWLCFVPGWFTATPLGQRFDATWAHRAVLLRRGFVCLMLLMLLATAINVPFRVVVPVSSAEAERLKLGYPVGAVAYLREQRFQGNVMTPFRMGAFVSWNLAPAVKVSLDGRYEVAYPPALLGEIVAFYEARRGWQDTLNRYPTDLVLVLNSDKIASHLDADAGWRRVYVDDLCSLYARPGLNLPVVDRTGQALIPKFP